MKFIYEEAIPFELYFNSPEEQDDAICKTEGIPFIPKIPVAFYGVDDKEIHLLLRKHRTTKDYMTLHDHELYHHIVDVNDWVMPNKMEEKKLINTPKDSLE